MEPIEPGTNNLLAHLQTDGVSVPWTPRDIRADRQRGNGLAGPAIPFVVQVGPSMLMIEGTGTGWVLAELRFDRERCVFREVRRATYSWPGEAFGVMLTRIASSEPSRDAVDRLTGEFAEWLGSGFARSRQ